MLNINIRPVKLQDFRDISRIRKMAGVMENILATPEEPEEKVKNKIENITENDYWYVAEANGQVIGVAILNRYSNQRKSHAAQISIMVDANFHSQGIGTALMRKLINLSDNILGLKRLELFVFIDNQKAIDLYKKFGFKVEGKQKYSALKNGKYTDELMMARIVC
jgi:putative acetyltransferase